MSKDKSEEIKRTIPEAYFDAAVAAIGVVGGAIATAFLWRMANRVIDHILEEEK